jgi:hypothetical protein
MDKIVFALKYVEIVEGDLVQARKIATEEADSMVAYNKIMKLGDQAEAKSMAEYDAWFFKKYPRPLYLGIGWDDPMEDIPGIPEDFRNEHKTDDFSTF